MCVLDIMKMGNIFPNKQMNFYSKPKKKQMSKKEEELVKKKIDDEIIGKRMYLIQRPYLITEKNIANLEEEINTKYIRELGRPIRYKEFLFLFHYEELKYCLC